MIYLYLIETLKLLLSRKINKVSKYKNIETISTSGEPKLFKIVPFPFG